MGNEGYVANETLQGLHNAGSIGCITHHAIAYAGQLLNECRDRSAGIDQALVTVDYLAIA